VTRAASKPKPGINGVPYVAANRFVIPDSDPAVVARFEEEMRRRETLMASLPGFTHCGLTKDGAHEYTFAQEWATKQAGASAFTAKGLRCRAELRVWALG
jgi:heme-degrading monooxygenase HmoA